MTNEIPKEELEVELDEKDKKIAELEDSLSKCKDQFLRLAAEFDNFKKTSMNNQAQSIRYANESLLNSFLPIIDNLEMALACGPNIQEKAGQDLLIGINMVLKLFADTLSKYGVHSFSGMGQNFDPNRHEAVSEEESDEVSPGTVLKEYQKGYVLHERLLRPARVVVAKVKNAIC